MAGKKRASQTSKTPCLCPCTSPAFSFPSPITIGQWNRCQHKCLPPSYCTVDRSGRTLTAFQNPHGINYTVAFFPSVCRSKSYPVIHSASSEHTRPFSSIGISFQEPRSAFSSSCPRFPAVAFSSSTSLSAWRFPF